MDDKTSRETKIYTFPSRSFCQRFATQQRTWLTSIDLGEGGDEGYEEGVANTRFRYKPYTKCIKGRIKIMLIII